VPIALSTETMKFLRWAAAGALSFSILLAVTAADAALDPQETPQDAPRAAPAPPEAPPSAPGLRVPPPSLRPRLQRRLPRLRMGVDEDAPDRVPLSIDRQISKEMETAAEEIGKQQFPDAVHHLQRVLDSAEDSWLEVPGPHGPAFQSAKRQAAERIAALPRQARESYETEYGQVARQLYDDAVRRGDAAQLAEVVRRYFHTKAGYKAAYALGNRLFDASMPLPAAHLFEELRKSPGGSAFEPMLSLKEALCWLRIGATDKCTGILSEMKERAGGTVTLGGHKETIPERTDATAWLAHLLGDEGKTKSPPVRDWMLAGGSPDRNAQSVEALPLGEAAWTQSLIRDRDLVMKDRFPEIETTLDEYRRELAEGEFLTLPSGMPLVIGNTVVFRTFARLRAVDLRTGEPLWDFAEGDRLYRILAAAHSQTRRGNRLPISMEPREQDDLRLFLNARAFRDMTYACLASDGERVFAIADGGFLGLDETQRTEQNETLGARNQNLLCGVDVATGRLLWELGGGRSDRNRDLAGTFFLGCGLPVGSALYVLGELDGEISLFKLDAASGKRLYSQRLATPLGRLAHYPLRRLAGGSPSWAAGLLICPTTGGLVMAFDPAARTLAWEYRYPINRTGVPSNWPDEPLDTGSDESNRWLDSSPVVVDGCVLLTPRDSDELHCLNLADGSLRWKQPRGNRLFVAAASDGIVYIVGRTGIEALRLKDASDAWGKAIELGTPAGRGYRNGNFYHLPLASGELATIDLHRGRIVTRTRFAEGVQPGNLVAAEGTVLMESAGALESFRPTGDLETSISRRLKRNPDDAAALATRGELRLHRGQAEAGLDDLTRSLKLRADPRVQTVAVATVLENLRFDFAASRALAERIAPQITESAQRVEFHRLMAAGLAHSGDLDGALDHDLDLLRDGSLGASLLPAGEALKIEVAQLVAPEVAELFTKADADGRSRLTKKIQEWTDHVAAGGEIDQLRRALAASGALPLEAELRLKLVAKLAESDRKKAAGKAKTADIDRADLVRQLTHLRQSADLKTAGTATARLARLLIDHHRAEEALDLLAELAGRFKSVTCADGKTGGELSSAWSGEPEVKAAKASLVPWPGSQWSVKTLPYERPSIEQVIAIPVEHRAGSFYRHWRFESRNATEGGFTLAAIDPAGNERWQLELDARNLGRGAWGDGPLAIRVQGPLIEVALRRRIALLDGFDGKEPPRVLWSRGLVDPHWSAANQMRSEMALIGLTTDDRVFYQLGSALCAADIVTGQTVWERRNIVFPYQLEGDREYVIAVSRNEPMDPSGMVLRAASGAVVSNDSFGVPGPLVGDWHGRRVLTASFTTRELTRSLVDLVARKVEWTQSYPLPSYPISIDDDEFAVLEGHTLHIHSTATGEELMKTTFDSSLNSPQLAVRRLGNRYIVLRQTAVFSLGPNSPRRVGGVDGNGIWAVERDTGKVAWSAALAPPQLLIDLPLQSPVLVTLRPVSRFESPRVTSLNTVVSIVESRTGRKLYEGREETSADHIHVRLDTDAHKVIVTTDKHRLEVSAKNAE
jgi:outer membrane protein assembly factor BamB